MWVLKVGGRQLDQPDFLEGLAGLLKKFERPPIVVHGGGKGTSALSQRLGLESRFVDGLRVTDTATLEAAVMGLAGLAKMQMVQGLVRHGLKALGLTGADAGLVRCRKLQHAQDLGWVGDPSRVDGAGLRQLAESGWVVCLSPLCLDEEGQLYNVNADPVAAAVAAGVQADTLIFLTDVAGILVEGQVVPEIDRALYDQLLERGHLTEGILPKLRACFEALDRGLEQVLISHLEGVAAWLQGQPAGTVVRNVSSSS
ncbi:acetylglutamate kinase [bacterium SCN 62-11]|nr:acetylglutamate kinase [Candidatus Eremiobacteraeota bacterium]ODT74669.1 MAG: acetylglutamate kinase [bacterium SCN 62-11]